MSQNDQLLKRMEAAEALTVSVRKFDYLVADGEIPIVKIGKSIRVRRSAIDRFVSSREAYAGGKKGGSK